MVQQEVENTRPRRSTGKVNYAAIEGEIDNEE